MAWSCPHPGSLLSIHPNLGRAGQKIKMTRSQAEKTTPPGCSSEAVAMSQHIGIVGCSAEGAALCYRTICTEGAALLGQPHAHPEVSMHTPSLADYTARIYRGDWAGVGALMLASAGKLAKIGADF